MRRNQSFAGKLTKRGRMTPMKKALLVMRLIAIAVLALAFIGGFPIGFYRFVRFVICGVCAL
jgi:hypothetical protein